jgi:hypothetical protein
MKVLAVTKARSLAFLEIDELNRNGTVRFFDCVAAIVERYQFIAFPQKTEDFDIEGKGIKFESGKAGDLTIDSLTIFNRAILVDTFSTTDDSKRIILDMLEWGKEVLGLTYSSEQITRWGHISDLVFSTDFPLLATFSSPLEKLALKTSEFTSMTFGGLPYQAMSLSIGHDPSVRKNAIASLVIQHRADTKFEENRYFSEAPLPTNLHIKYLDEFEADVLESRRSG